MFPTTMVSAWSVPFASQNLHCSGTRNLSSVSGTLAQNCIGGARTQHMSLNSGKNRRSATKVNRVTSEAA